MSVGNTTQASIYGNMLAVLAYMTKCDFKSSKNDIQ